MARRRFARAAGRGRGGGGAVVLGAGSAACAPVVSCVCWTTTFGPLTDGCGCFAVGCGACVVLVGVVVCVVVLGGGLTGVRGRARTGARRRRSAWSPWCWSASGSVLRRRRGRRSRRGSGTGRGFGRERATGQRPAQPDRRQAHRPLAPRGSRDAPSRAQARLNARVVYARHAWPLLIRFSSHGRVRAGHPIPREPPDPIHIGREARLRKGFVIGAVICGVKWRIAGAYSCS